MENFYYTLLNLWNNIRRFPRRVISWAIKSVQYSVFLWNDYDFDYGSLLTLMKYKINRMRKCIAHNDIIADAREVCQEMKDAEEKIDIVIDEPFLNLYDEFDKKWWPDGRHLETFNTHHGNKEYEKELKELMNKMSTLDEAAWEDLWAHIKTHMRKWWD